MALTAGEVQSKPDLAVAGMVKEVGAVALSKSEKAYYYVLPIYIDAKFGQSGSTHAFYFLFRPEWFAAGFDPHDLIDGSKDGEVRFGFYRRMVANRLTSKDGERLQSAQPSVLQAILGDQFDKFAAEFDSLTGEPDETQVAALIRKYITGLDVVYVLNQRKDNGELSEQYNVVSFTDDPNGLVKQSQNKNRKRGPLVITWDE
jgi:hypothetical protein